MRAGILIVGSLRWDNSSRETWRKSRLVLDRAVSVKVPIYYGRRSGEKRGHCFTMTIAANGDLGQALVVPCAREIHRVDDLMLEAQCLWKAEMVPKDPPTPECISAPWGCVGARFRDSVAHSAWVDAWTVKFRNTNPNVVAPVGVHGLLNIPWPEAVRDLDVLLATATLAEATRPSPKDVAEAWAAQEAGHENYFLRNLRYGIRTPDDDAIWKHLKDRRPRPQWLTRYLNATALSHEEIAIEAYLRYRHRLERAEPGTALADWLAAEQMVRARRRLESPMGFP